MNIMRTSHWFTCDCFPTWYSLASLSNSSQNMKFTHTGECRKPPRRHAAHTKPIYLLPSSRLRWSAWGVSVSRTLQSHCSLKLLSTQLPSLLCLQGKVFYLLQHTFMCYVLDTCLLRFEVVYPSLSYKRYKCNASFCKMQDWSRNI